MFNQRRQRGLTMFSFLFVTAILVFMAMLAMKLVPAYIEFFSIKKVLTEIGKMPNIKTMSNAEIRTSYAKRASIDYITTVKASDLEIGRLNGVAVASVNYTYQTPLIANISLLVEFKASSDSNSGSVVTPVE